MNYHVFVIILVVRFVGLGINANSVRDRDSGVKVRGIRGPGRGGGRENGQKRGIEVFC